MEYKWTGYTSAVSLSATIQNRNFAQYRYGENLSFQSSGPSSGTWTATVEIYKSVDGKKFVLLHTHAISNSTPSIISESITSCSYFGIIIKNVTGTIPGTPDADGVSGINVNIFG